MRKPALSRYEPSRRRGLAFGVSISVVLGGALVAAPPSQAGQPTSASIVISEVYGGGGNSGAILKQDFVELYNPTAAALPLDGWSVQYASSTGSFSPTNKTILSGSIPANGYFLVAEARGTGGTIELPTPDVTGSIAMSGTAGKVALVLDSTTLPCGTDCDSFATVVDFVGYGSTANDYEGTGPAPYPSGNTDSATRDALGTDTNNNAADFTPLEPPLPTNSAGETPDYGGDEDPIPLTIAEIQGVGHLSDDEGDLVETTGVVTALTGNGYFVQDPVGDGNPQSSEGLFVFTGADAKPSVGDSIAVTGTVDEFRPQSATGPGLNITELTDSTFEVNATSAPLPTPVLIGDPGVMPPTQTIDDDSATRIDIEVAGSYDPSGDAIDFYEQYEGMLLQLDNPEVVGPTTVNGELPLVPSAPIDAIRSANGGVIYGGYDLPNATRIIADDEVIIDPMPAANTGDSLAGSVVGAPTYSFSNYKLELTEVPTVVSGGTTRDVAKKAKKKELSVATFNVENLDPSDPQSKFDDLAEIVVDHLRSPDVLALEEVQDNNGAVDDGTVDASQTLDQFVAAIDAAGGPSYAWTEINPLDGEDGGEPGGNIRVAFLYRTDRGLTFNQRGEGDATTPTEVTEIDGKVALTLSPGRVDPNNPAWEATRKPLAAEFTWRKEKVFVIANHFSSKGGDEPLFGRWQPPTRSSEDKRHQQAASVNAFVQDLLDADPKAKIVVAGDLNDFEFSETLDILTDGGADLADLIQYKKASERWTYVFDGNSQVLDHLLVSPSLAPTKVITKKVRIKKDYEVVHVNADFADQVSDHDPQVVRLRIGKGKVE